MSSATGGVRTQVTVNRPDLTRVGVIVWLSSELMFFAGLFAVYFTHRAVAAPGEFEAGHDLLNLPFSTVNTLVLIASSVTCQLGVDAAEHLRPRRTGSMFQVRQWGMSEWFVLTYIMGSVFIGGQVFEYAELASEGLTPQVSSFGSVFFIATGFHGLHVTGGLIAFLFIIGKAFMTKRFGHHEATTAIVVSYYWHFVDVVWIALFGVIYLLPLIAP